MLETAHLSQGLPVFQVFLSGFQHHVLCETSVGKRYEMGQNPKMIVVFLYLEH